MAGSVKITMKLENVLDTCAEPVVIYDDQGEAVYVNAAFEALFGWPAAALLGKRIDFVPEDQVEATRKTMAKVMAGETVSAFETRRKTCEGDIVDVRMTAARLAGDGGSIQGMVLTFQDISELVRYREEALAAAQAKRRFLSNISHEVRTPMNHVMGMIDLLGQTDLSEEQQEYIDILQGSADQLMDVVTDMLDFSGMESRSPDCRNIEFDLRAMADRVAHLIDARARRKGLSFDMEIHPLVPPLVVGDPEHLRKVLNHLCTNAVKFTEQGGVALHILPETGGGVRFEVRDTGIGIPKRELEKIFDSFSQADDSATRKYGGTGLGLSIAARLVEAMDGKVLVDSEPGKGSTFSFSLAFDQQADCDALPTGKFVPRSDPGTAAAEPDNPAGVNEDPAREGNDGIQVFNTAAALERAMNDRAFLEMLVNEFLSMLPDKIQEIKAACRNGEGKHLALAAQALKGGAANLGAEEICVAAAALERMGEACLFTEWETACKYLESACTRFKTDADQTQWGEL